MSSSSNQAGSNPDPAIATLKPPLADRRSGDERLRIGLVLGHAAAGNDSDIAEELQLDELTVRKWRRRCG